MRTIAQRLWTAALAGMCVLLIFNVGRMTATLYRRSLNPAQSPPTPQYDEDDVFDFEQQSGNNGSSSSSAAAVAAGKYGRGGGMATAALVSHVRIVVPMEGGSAAGASLVWRAWAFLFPQPRFLTWTRTFSSSSSSTTTLADTAARDVGDGSALRVSGSGPSAAAVVNAFLRSECPEFLAAAAATSAAEKKKAKAKANAPQWLLVTRADSLVAVHKLAGALASIDARRPVFLGALADGGGLEVVEREKKRIRSGAAVAVSSGALAEMCALPESRWALGSGGGGGGVQSWEEGLLAVALAAKGVAVHDASALFSWDDALGAHTRTVLGSVAVIGGIGGDTLLQAGTLAYRILRLQEFGPLPSAASARSAG